MRRVAAPSKDEKQVAMFLAMIVRNSMEDFHIENLSDKQMKILNPIIRNAILTGLFIMQNAHQHKRIESIFNWTMGAIPEYWEEPVLLQEYISAVTGERLYGNDPVEIV